MKKTAIIILSILLLLFLTPAAPYREPAGASSDNPTSVAYPILTLGDGQTLSSADYCIDFSKGTTTASGAPDADLYAEFSLDCRDGKDEAQIALAFDGSRALYKGILEGAVVSCNGEELTKRCIILPGLLGRENVLDLLTRADARCTGFGNQKGILYTVDLSDVPQKRSLDLEFDMDKNTRYLYSDVNAGSYLDGETQTHIRLNFPSRDSGGETASLFLIGGDISNITAYYYGGLGLKHHTQFNARREEISLDDYLSSMSGFEQVTASEEIKEEIFINRATALKKLLDGQSYGTGYDSIDRPMGGYSLYYLYNASLKNGDNTLSICYPMFSESEIFKDTYYDPTVYTYTKSSFVSDFLQRYPSNNSLHVIPNVETPYMLENSSFNIEANGSYTYASDALPENLRLSFCSSQEPVDLGHPSESCIQFEERNWIRTLFAMGAGFYIILLACVGFITLITVLVVKRVRIR